MKILTELTIVLTIPTITYGFLGKSQVAFSSRPLSFVICSGCFASNQCISLVMVKKEKISLEKFIKL